MAGNRAGVEKTAAARLGMSVEAMRARIVAGERWCTACKGWHALSAFGSDTSRGARKATACLASRSTGRPKGWHGRPAINQATGRPGPAPAKARDEDRLQARHRVNLEVRSGRLARPNSLPCFDCRHVHGESDQRRHEYDHFKGYAAEHHLNVQAVCTKCHHARERQRKEGT